MPMLELVQVSSFYIFGMDIHHVTDKYVKSCTFQIGYKSMN